MRFLKPLLLLFISSYTFYLAAQTQIGQSIHDPTIITWSGSSVSISADGNRVAIGANYSDVNGSNTGQVRIFEWNNNQWIQLGDDINGENSYDQSGANVSISADGNRIAIGARFNNDHAIHSGHTRVFEWNNDQWIQLGNDIDGEFTDDYSGFSNSLSMDGSRVAIGAIQNNGNGPNSGYTRIFEWNNNEWNQLGNDINGENTADESGQSVSFSADGNRVAIGAKLNDGNGTNSGHIRIFEWDNNQWMQLGFDIDGENSGDLFGESVSISANGNRVAIGAIFSDDNGTNSGHARIFEWDNNQWTQLGSAIVGEQANDRFGSSISISADGSRVAIGAIYNDGNGTNSGHTRIFDWSNNEWTQSGNDIDGENMEDESGASVSLTADGNRLVVGAPKAFNSAGQTKIFNLGKPNITSNDLCFTLDHNPDQTQYILEGDFSNCNIFVLDENENVVQFLLNFNDKITIELDELPAGLHFIRVEHQQHGELFVQEIIKQ